MTYEEVAAGPLARGLAELAGTPDEAPDLEERLAALARLAVDRVGAADFASVTAMRAGSYTTVAVSSELIQAVDEVQNTQKEGPCVDALTQEQPVAESHLATSVRWPGFTAEALRLGLAASLSMPLFTAGGGPVAALNLHGRDSDAMAPLIAGVWAIFDPDGELPATPRAALDEGGRELLAGFTEAVAVRATIQQALYAIMDRHGVLMNAAYLRLTAMAAQSGEPVRAVAEALLAGDH